MGLPDAALPVLAEWLARIVAGNLLVFVAVLPLTLLASLFVDGVYACTASAFVYGFFASMEAAILNYYPAKAVLILVDPRCGVGYDFVHYSPGVRRPHAAGGPGGFGGGFLPLCIPAKG